MQTECRWRLVRSRNPYLKLSKYVSTRLFLMLLSPRSPVFPYGRANLLVTRSTETIVFSAALISVLSGLAAVSAFRRYVQHGDR